jgi:hypothetical protein
MPHFVWDQKASQESQEYTIMTLIPDLQTAICVEVSARVARWDIFVPKNPNFSKFWRALQKEMFVHFMAIWYIF